MYGRKDGIDLKILKENKSSMQEDSRYRHEYKYLIHTYQLEEIRQRLAAVMQKDPHAQNGKYTIRSLYFDDWKNSCYYENENGTSPREKCRIRIYNGSAERLRLEWKRREHEKIQKRSCPIERKQVERLLTGEGLLWDEQMDPLLKKLYIRQETALMKPKVIVEYDRIPFVERNGNVRVTLDMDICAADSKEFFSERLSARPVMPVGIQMLEVKFDEFLPDAVRQTIETERLRQSTFSKYYFCRKVGGILL